jgi:Putative Flp pilus-assembly TadE/G-like/D-alanyl-D-alanine carboxypeptidase
MAVAGDPVGWRREGGQASLLLLGVMFVLLAGAVVLFAFGSALGSKGRHQRAADLAAVSAGQVMRELYPRLFEPPVLANGLPNPRHLPLPVYVALVRRAAVRGARRNGVEVSGADVSFPGGGFAPTRVAVRVRGVARVRVKRGGGRRREVVPVTARATAEIAPDLNVPLGMPAFGSGGGYDGPLAYRMGRPMRPDVAVAFDRMAAAAREEAGLFLSINSAFRSDAEQASLFAQKPNPYLFSAL